jgi:hypothetical protein
MPTFCRFAMGHPHPAPLVPDRARVAPVSHLCRTSVATFFAASVATIIGT